MCSSDLKAPAKKAVKKAPAKKATAKKATAKTAAKKATAKKATAKTAAKKTTAKKTEPAADAVEPQGTTDPVAPEPAPASAEPAPASAEPTPVVPEASADADAHADATSQAPAATRVVVAEDEALIRLDLVELLRDEGYDVVGEVGDGEAAVEKARELRPDLVVMDVQMPQMDGITAAQIIASERIAPVVMLTAFSQRELVERAREAGAMAYVVKPFGAADVVPAIEMAIARFNEIRAVEAEVEDLEERLASRKAVDQAKGLLQTGMGMTEQEAFRWIQKTAMDLRKPMRDVAEGIIAHAKKSKTK